MGWMPLKMRTGRNVDGVSGTAAKAACAAQSSWDLRRPALRIPVSAAEGSPDEKQSRNHRHRRRRPTGRGRTDSCRKRREGAPIAYTLRRGGRDRDRRVDPLRDHRRGREDSSDDDLDRRWRGHGPRQRRRDLHGPGDRRRRHARAALCRRRDPRADQPRTTFAQKTTELQLFEARKLRGAREHHAPWRLQLRRALAGRQDAVPHRVHGSARPRRLPGALL